jgi:transcriptional regulator with XRE-family HTH domain
MESHILGNYLRTYRQRIGLTQPELAFLLGMESGGSVSRYENGHRLPLLRTALTFEAVLGVHVSEIFAGVRAEIEHEVVSRIQQFRTTQINDVQNERRRITNRMTRVISALEKGRCDAQK